MLSQTGEFTLQANQIPTRSNTGRDPTTPLMTPAKILYNRLADLLPGEDSLMDMPIGTESVQTEIKGSSAFELKRFYILEEYHGKGLAQKMMHFLIDHAVSEGYDCIFLGVWEHNLRAQKFYHKFQFKLQKQQRYKIRYTATF